MHFLADHGAAGSGSRRARHVVATLAEGIEDLLRATAAYGASEVETARSRVRRQLDELRHEAGGGIGRGRAGRAAAAATACARRHVWISLAIVGVAGVAAGCCLRGRAGRHAARR